MNDEPPFPWMKDKPNTYRYHLDNDTGSFLQYTRAKRLHLGGSLLKLRRIYLDTKYWLYVRDVYLNRPQKQIHSKIVEEFRQLRRDGSTSCPISCSVFIELLYQSDAATRTATATMIDELSDGCTIQPLFEVFRRELYHFISRLTKPNVSLYNIKQMVWTKAAFVLGDVFLSLEGSGIPEPQALAIRKAIDDALWATKLSEMIQALPPDDGTERSRASDFAETLTGGKFGHQAESDTFEKLFLDEIAGVVDALSDICGDLMVHLARENLVMDEIPQSQALAGGRMLGNVIRGAFEHKRITTEFPTLSIPAALHAAVRFDKKRKYKKGDCEDFHHAALAVGYFDVFLTESSLEHLLISKDIDAKKNYGCTVLSDEREVFEHLRSLN